MKRSIILSVAIAICLLAFVLVFTASSAPECTCTTARATRNTPTGFTYTVSITATGASCYRVIQYPSGPVVGSPQTNHVYSSLVLTGNHTYQAQVAQSCSGPWSGSSGCNIQLSPTAVSVTDFSAEATAVDYQTWLWVALVVAGVIGLLIWRNRPK